MSDLDELSEHDEMLDEILEDRQEQIDQLRAALAETAACLEWANGKNVAILRDRLLCREHVIQKDQAALRRIDVALAKAKQEGRK